MIIHPERQCAPQRRKDIGRVTRNKLGYHSLCGAGLHPPAQRHLTSLSLSTDRSDDCLHLH